MKVYIKCTKNSVKINKPLTEQLLQSILNRLSISEDIGTSTVVLNMRDHNDNAIPFDNAIITFDIPMEDEDQEIDRANKVARALYLGTIGTGYRPELDAIPDNTHFVFAIEPEISRHLKFEPIEELISDTLTSFEPTPSELFSYEISLTNDGAIYLALEADSDNNFALKNKHAAVINRWATNLMNSLEDAAYESEKADDGYYLVYRDIVKALSAASIKYVMDSEDTEPNMVLSVLVPPEDYEIVE